jgi:hypothetical protein
MSSNHLKIYVKLLRCRRIKFPIPIYCQIHLKHFQSLPVTFAPTFTILSLEISSERELFIKFVNLHFVRKFTFPINSHQQLIRTKAHEINNLHPPLLPSTAIIVDVLFIFILGSRWYFPRKLFK